MRRRFIPTLLLLGLLSTGAFAAQTTLNEAVADIAHRWSQATYQTPEGQKEAAFASLAASAGRVSQSFPGRAEPLVWQTITLSSYAQAEGGLGALSTLKQARDLLLSAEKIDPIALDGSVYDSLGILYEKVPGWPISFGDKEKAKVYLDKALDIAPGSMDANYFYAEMLVDQGRYASANEYLKRALAAAPRRDREDADAGRRKEILQLQSVIRQKSGAPRSQG
jgi:tetratricopeptide (TPR) repeat protein